MKQQQSRTFLNQQVQTTPSGDLTHEWKAVPEGMARLQPNTFIAQCLVDLNRKRPLAYQLLNAMPEPLPESRLFHQTRIDWRAVPSPRAILNPVTTAELETAGPFLHHW